MFRRRVSVALLSLSLWLTGCAAYELDERGYSNSRYPSYGDSRSAYPDRVYISIRKGAKPEDAAGRHWCFKAKWQTQVDAFWDAGIAAGCSDDGAPGLRNYHASYYAAFLRDPDGNRIEAVCHAAI